MKFFKDSEYQEKCAILFRRYASEISEILPNAQVEHIGSSSVPGALSKGDLDIYVGVVPEEHENSVLALIGCGFKEKEDTLRTSELCMLVTQEDVALQVVAIGSEFEFFLRFRDLLRERPELVQLYNELKNSCISFTQEQYRSKKSKFIEAVLKNA